MASGPQSGPWSLRLGKALSSLKTHLTQVASGDHISPFPSLDLPSRTGSAMHFRVPVTTHSPPAPAQCPRTQANPGSSVCPPGQPGSSLAPSMQVTVSPVQQAPGLSICRTLRPSVSSSENSDTAGQGSTHLRHKPQLTSCGPGVRGHWTWTSGGCELQTCLHSLPTSVIKGKQRVSPSGIQVA